MANRHLTSLNPVVKISNALARASRAVKSVYEPRLVALIASRVRQDDLDFQEYEISLSDLLGGASDGRTHKLVATVVDGLLGRILTLPRANGWAKYGIFSKCEYDGQAGLIRARFDPDLRPHFLSLNEYFTEYSLTEFLLLPSTYSQRLFEVLKSWDDKPQVEISLSDLFSMLDVPSSHRSDFAAFRRRVLEKAKKDISEKTTLRFEWEAIKKGRAVVSVRFIFGRRAVVVESKKSKEQKQKISEINNSLMKKAVNCFLEKGEKCSPEKTKQCDLCLRFVKSNKADTNDEHMQASEPLIPEKSFEIASKSNEKPPVSSSVTSDQFIKALHDYGLNTEMAYDVVTQLIHENLLEAGWASIPDARNTYNALPRVKRRNFGKFLKKWLVEDKLNRRWLPKK